MPRTESKYEPQKFNLRGDDCSDAFFGVEFADRGELLFIYSGLYPPGYLLGGVETLLWTKSVGKCGDHVVRGKRWRARESREFWQSIRDIFEPYLEYFDEKDLSPDFVLTPTQLEVLVPPSALSDPDGGFFSSAFHPDLREIEETFQRLADDLQQRAEELGMRD